MELLESIQKSLIEQNRTHGRILYSSTNKNFIGSSIWWNATIEGFLFWEILHSSYYYHGTYDYDTIIKLYNLYGAEVFKLSIPYESNMSNEYYDYEANTLTSEGFEYLCKQIERYGIVRKHSEEFS